MRLAVREEAPTLFAVGEVLEDVQFVPGIWKPGLLVVPLTAGKRRFITLSQAKRDNLQVVNATDEELHMLTGAGYSMPIDLSMSGPKGRK